MNFIASQIQRYGGVVVYIYRFTLSYSLCAIYEKQFPHSISRLSLFNLFNHPSPLWRYLKILTLSEYSLQNAVEASK